MPKALNKFFSVLILLGIGFFFFFLGRNLLFPRFGEDLHEFFFFHLLAVSLSDLMEFFIPLFLSSLAVSFSFFVKPADLPQTDRGKIHPAKAIQLALVPIALGLFFDTFSVLGMRPALEAQINDWEYRARSEEILLAKLDALRNIDYLHEKLVFQKPASQKKMSPTTSWLTTDEKISLVRKLISLRPEVKSYQFRLRLLLSQRISEDFVETRRLPFPEGWYLDSFAGLPPESLLDQSRNYLLREDFANANFRAFLAFQMLSQLQLTHPEDFRHEEEKLLQEARALVNQSWSASLEMRFSQDEKLRASYFFRKGKSLGDYNFHNYLEAYYGFLELSRENPKDLESQKYLNLSLQKIRDKVLFREDLHQLFVIPGNENLVFLNPLPVGAPADVKEIVSIGHLIEVETGVYVKNIQVLRFNQKGETLLHWKAEFGKWEGAFMNLELRSKNGPGDEHLPVVLTAKGNVPLSGPPLMWPIQVSVDNLKALSAIDGRFESLNMIQVLELGKTLESLGYTSIPAKTEFVVRILNALFLLVVSFMTLWLSWVLRSKYVSSPPRSLQLILVSLPLVIAFLLESLQWVLMLMTGALLRWSGEAGFYGLIITFSVMTIPASILFIYGAWSVLRK